MGNKKRKNTIGNYISAHDYLSIRQKITLPKIKKNRAGKTEMIAGFCEWFVFHGKHKMSDALKNKNEAIIFANKLLAEKKKYKKNEMAN